MLIRFFVNEISLVKLDRIFLFCSCFEQFKVYSVIQRMDGVTSLLYDSESHLSAGEVGSIRESNLISRPWANVVSLILKIDTECIKVYIGMFSARTLEL